MSALVEMQQISKIYPNGVVANKGVDFAVEKGEIHALVGENGAGKSTLMKILYGLEQPTHGEILLDGRSSQDSEPAAGHRSGHRHGAPELHAGALFHHRRKHRAGQRAAQGALRRPQPGDCRHRGAEPRLRSASRANRAHRGHAGGDAPARRDSQDALPRRRPAHPRRADGRAHAAGDGRTLPGGAQAGRPGQDGDLHHPQAGGGEGDFRPRHGDAPRRSHRARRHPRCERGGHCAHDGGARRLPADRQTAAARGVAWSPRCAT
jgi:energy-coupling factor transporter ATP-binding protein EcfA2